MLSNELFLSSSSTLVIMLGASEWPRSPSFNKSQAFTNSARIIKEYFLDKSKFGLPVENLLDLFDSTNSYDEIDDQISQFLENRITTLRQSGIPPNDLFVYYVGHGGFVHGHDEFYLAIRRTREENPQASSITIHSLAKTLKEQARNLRRFLILDCCFAAAAYKAFQGSGPEQAAIVQAIEAFEEPGKGKGIPKRGTSLFCSSSSNTVSRLTPNESYTMFSQAVVHALSNGNPNQQELLALRGVRDLADDFLISNYGMARPRPEVHSPDQKEGDIASIPLFPNLAYRAESTQSFNKLEIPAIDPDQNEQLDELVRDQAIETVKAQFEKSTTIATWLEQHILVLIAIIPVSILLVFFASMTYETKDDLMNRLSKYPLQEKVIDPINSNTPPTTNRELIRLALDVEVAVEVRPLIFEKDDKFEITVEGKKPRTIFDHTYFFEDVPCRKGNVVINILSNRARSILKENYTNHFNPDERWKVEERYTTVLEGPLCSTAEQRVNLSTNGPIKLHGTWVKLH